MSPRWPRPHTGHEGNRQYVGTFGEVDVYAGTATESCYALEVRYGVEEAAQAFADCVDPLLASYHRRIGHSGHKPQSTEAIVVALTLLGYIR